MISLTFVKNSNGSHGTVDRTTGFWSARYGFESTAFTYTFKFDYHDGKSWYSPPPLSIKVLATRKFLKQSTEGFPQRNFSVPRRKIFDGNSWYYPTSHPWTFPLPEFFWNTARWGSRTKSFCIVRQKKIRQKIVISTSYGWKFLKPETSETAKGSPTKSFVTAGRKTFDRKSCNLLSYPKNFPTPENFWSTERFLYEKLRYCETKKFDKKSCQAPLSLSLSLSLIHKIFQNQKPSWARKGSSTKCIGIVGRNNSTENRNRRSLLSYQWNFWTSELLWNAQGFPYEIFGTVRQQIFNGKSWYSLFCIKYRNQWWNCSLLKTFGS